MPITMTKDGRKRKNEIPHAKDLSPEKDAENGEGRQDQDKREYGAHLVFRPASGTMVLKAENCVSAGQEAYREGDKLHTDRSVR